jgi:predicted RNA-binding protein with PIN domain
MIYLIDGYNLFHAAGYALPTGATRTAFESARNRFLDWLANAKSLRNGEAEFRCIFDAPNATVNFGSSSHRGVRYTFTYQQTADDLIEEVLRREARAKAMTVISNDGRLRDSALRSGALWMPCGDFVDLVNEGAPAPKAKSKSEAAEKPSAPGDELQELLKAFQQPK